MNDHKKNKVKFCWHCGKKLYGNIHERLIYQGYARILHKQCASFLKTGHPIVKRDDEYFKEEALCQKDQ